MELKGSKTEKNILIAFAGESQARNKYNFFSSKAKKEGYVQIADIFEEGIREYRDAVKKSEEFLNETIKLFNVESTEKDGHKGYLIKGKSGRQYLLTTDCQIYDFKTMKYICIVDKTIGGGFQNDKLVSRIFALANDSMTAEHIYTLKK